MTDRLWWWRNSIGSSTVTMCSGLVRLMMSISEASEVDFPDPVGPVTSTRPRRRSVNAFTDSGSPRSSNCGMSWGIGRSATATVPRCSATFTRNRPTPATECEVSSSWSASNRSRLLAGSTPKIISCRVSPSSGSMSSMGRRAPWSRTVGARLAERWRSDAPTLTT